MELTSLIQIDKKFQSSVNLEFDLNDVEKVNGYIPTAQATSIIDTYLHAIHSPSSEKHSTVLVGPYGRGKSHLLLVLAALVSLDIEHNNLESKHAISNLIKKIARINPETANIAKNIVDKRIRLLPVILNSNSGDINQSLIMGLKNALERANLNSLLPATHFDAAINTIALWKSDYPDAYSAFSKEVSLRKHNVESLLIGLHQYSSDSYEEFCDIYPRVAVGAKFNPYVNMDAIRLYSSVNNALKNQTAFSGMLVIFDEFSKFIESNLDERKMNNFKIIQDLAELADRSFSPQLHFVCVTHKTILDYSTSDSFKTVEGRFKTIEFVASSEQSYELVANALIKTDLFCEFKEQHKLEFKHLYEQTVNTGLFSDLSNTAIQNTLVYGCFPISPLSAYSLLRISEKVGQNERTLFTFLTQSDKNALPSYLNRNQGFSPVTIDYVFDYFSDVFRKNTFDQSTHSMWSKAFSAIKQLGDSSNAIKIVKAIALIKIISDDRIKPITTHIKASLNMSTSDFNQALGLLLKKEIVAQRDSSEFVLLTANGVDVQNKINNYLNGSIVHFDKERCQILGDICAEKFILPRQYNDEHGMLRYFSVRFVSSSELLRASSLLYLQNSTNADGVLINVLLDDENHIVELTNKIYASKCSMSVFCIPNKVFDDTICRKYYAIQQLKNSEQAKIDTHYYEELLIFEEDAHASILKRIGDYFGADSLICDFYTINGKELFIHKQAHLNKLVSAMCYTTYSKTPSINNELVNRHNPSTQIKKARETVIDYIFQNASASSIPIMKGTSSEATLFRSVYCSTNIITGQYNAEMTDVLNTIRDYILSAEGTAVELSNLYKTLISAPYGMREGVIPMLIAFVLKDYIDKTVIYFKSSEIELSSQVLSSINDAHGEGYYILIESGTAIKERILNSLESLFSAYFDNYNEHNKIYSIVRAMQNWFRGLPEFSKKCRQTVLNNKLVNLSDKDISIRKELLRFELNAHSFIFEKLMPCSNQEELHADIEWINSFKKKLDNHVLSMTNYVRYVSIKEIPGNYNGSLTQALKNWCDILSQKTKQHMFSTLTNELLSYVVTLSTYDDDKALNDLCKIFVGIRIADWSDSSFEQYLANIRSAIAEISDYENAFKTEQKVQDENGIEITFNGKSISKTFSAMQTSPLGKTLYNNLQSVFEEYGDSVAPEEKLNIIINVLKSILE